MRVGAAFRAVSGISSIVYSVSCRDKRKLSQAYRARDDSELARTRRARGWRHCPLPLPTHTPKHTRQQLCACLRTGSAIVRQLRAAAGVAWLKAGLVASTDEHADAASLPTNESVNSVFVGEKEDAAFKDSRACQAQPRPRSPPQRIRSGRCQAKDCAQKIVATYVLQDCGACGYHNLGKAPVLSVLLVLLGRVEFLTLLFSPVESSKATVSQAKGLAFVCWAAHTQPLAQPAQCRW